MSRAVRAERAKKVVAYLKKTYPLPKSELLAEEPMQFVASVILSAQCTDKAVNKLTATLFKKYKTPADFARADLATFTAEISSGELHNVWEGIATDTHVKRFAKRFDLTDNDDPTKISKDLEALIPKKDWKYVNNGLVLYGRYVCPARQHDCGNHSLTKLWPPAGHRWPKGEVGRQYSDR